MMARQPFVRPELGTITRGADGTVVELRFEPDPRCPHLAFRATDLDGKPIRFHRGDLVHVDQLAPGQSVLIANRVEHV